MYTRWKILAWVLIGCQTKCYSSFFWPEDFRLCKYIIFNFYKTAVSQKFVRPRVRVWKASNTRQDKLCVITAPICFHIPALWIFGILVARWLFGLLKMQEQKNREAWQLFRSNIYEAQMIAEGIILSSSVVSPAPATERGQGSAACLQFCQAVWTSASSAKKEDLPSTTVGAEDPVFTASYRLALNWSCGWALISGGRRVSCVPGAHMALGSSLWKLGHALKYLPLVRTKAW